MRHIKPFSLFQKRVARRLSSSHSVGRRRLSLPLAVATESLEPRCLLSAGDLDPSFGVAGKVTTSFGTSSAQATTIAIQSDGRIVVAGYSSIGGDNDFALARYKSDGSLDTSFDDDGTLTTDFGTSVV